MSYQLIQSKPIYQGRVFSVRKDEVRLPNGHVSELDIVDHPGAVILLPVDQDGRIWFIRQFRYSAGEILLELPAGTMEAGETAENCALREIREETGMRAGRIQKIGEFFMAPGYSNEYLYLFLAEDLAPDPLKGDEDEVIQVEPMEISQAFKMAEGGEVRDAKTLAALLIARQYLRY